MSSRAGSRLLKPLSPLTEHSILRRSLSTDSLTSMPTISLPQQSSNKIHEQYVHTLSAPPRPTVSSTTSVAIRKPLQQTRQVQIQATPSTPDLPLSSTTSAAQDGPDAAFEVVASPASSPSLLSISLQPSHPLHTRRGTLVALYGASPDHTISTLSPLSPILRAPLGIPFLYQRLSSASPLRLLLAARGNGTSFCVLNIDGTQDWMVTQRNALVAWTGASLSATPNVATAFGIAHFGQTQLTGRGLVALAAGGGSYSVVLGQGEHFTAAPGHVLAYSVGRHKPEPYRLASTTLRLTVPDLTGWLPDVKFFHEVRKSSGWKVLARTLYRMRTWSRRTIFGDRLLVRFTGPGTVLLQGRGASVTDVITNREVNEIMDSRSGSVLQGIEAAERKAAVKAEQESATASAQGKKQPVLKTATVGQDGKVQFR